MNGAVNGHDAALAWEHAHPFIMLSISSIASLIVVGIIVTLRWAFSSKAWKYHPGGAGGFLKDEFLRLGVIFLPWLLIGLIFRYYVYELHPELNSPNTWAVFLGAAIIIRMIARRLPVVKAVGRHLDAARAQARAARTAAPAPAST